MLQIKEISAFELSQLIKSTNNIELIDIRKPVEIERGIIPGSKALPMHLIPLNLNYFSTAQKEIVIYCRTGSRSAQVCRFLNQHGLNNTISLRGGIVQWTSSGLRMAFETPEAIA